MHFSYKMISINILMNIWQQSILATFCKYQRSLFPSVIHCRCLQYLVTTNHAGMGHITQQCTQRVGTLEDNHAGTQAYNQHDHKSTNCAAKGCVGPGHHSTQPGCGISLSVRLAWLRQMVAQCLGRAGAEQLQWLLWLWAALVWG